MLRRADGAGRDALAKEGFAERPAPVRADRRPALLRPGLRGAGAGARRATSTRRAARASPTRFHAEHRALYGYDFAGDPTQQVEWVNLRVSGIGPIQRPEIRSSRRGFETGASAPPRPPVGHPRPGLLRRRRRVRRHPGALAPRPAARHGRRGPGDHRGVRLDGAAAPGLRRPDRRLPQPHRDQERTHERARAPTALPVRLADRRRRRERRPGAGRDRAGLPGQRRDGGRDRDRAHQPQPDDPRRPRLPGRHPRPAAAQAHRPLVLRAGAPGRPRLPDRGDAARATSSSTTTSTAPRAASGTCPTSA